MAAADILLRSVSTGDIQLDNKSTVDTSVRIILSAVSDEHIPAVQVPYVKKPWDGIAARVAAYAIAQEVSTFVIVDSISVAATAIVGETPFGPRLINVSATAATPSVSSSVDLTTGSIPANFTSSCTVATTIIDANGNVNYPPNNIFQHSQDFTDAFWTSVSVGINLGSCVANTMATLDPFGGNNATFVCEDATTGYHDFDTYYAPRGNYCLSVYAKPAGRLAIDLHLGSNNCIYDLEGPGSVETGVNGGITYVGNGWYRCWVYGLSVNTNSSIWIAVGTNVSYAGDGVSGIYFYGAQLEQIADQTTPSAYMPTTGSAYSGPRIDYNPSTHACKGLLVERESTNLLNHSTTLTTAGGSNNNWANVTLTRTSTDNAAPDTSLAALRLTATSSNSTIKSSAVVGSSATRTLSVYLRRVTGTGDIQYTTDNGTGWTTQAITSTWTRYVFPATTENQRVGFRVTTNTDAIEIWGVQLEDGSTATSLIPTRFDRVTRPDSYVSMPIAAGMNALEVTLSDNSTQTVTVTPGTPFSFPGNYATNWAKGLLLTGGLQQTIVSQPLLQIELTAAAGSLEFPFSIQSTGATTSAANLSTTEEISLAKVSATSAAAALTPSIAQAGLSASATSGTNTLIWKASLTLVTAWSTAQSYSFTPGVSLTINKAAASSTIGALGSQVSASTVPATSTSVAANLAWSLSATLSQATSSGVARTASPLVNYLLTNAAAISSASDLHSDEQINLLSHPTVSCLVGLLNIPQNIYPSPALGTAAANTFTTSEFITIILSSCVSSATSLNLVQTIGWPSTSATGSAATFAPYLSVSSLSATSTPLAADLRPAEQIYLLSIPAITGTAASLAVSESLTLISATSSISVSQVEFGEFINALPASCSTSATALHPIETITSTAAGAISSAAAISAYLTQAGISVYAATTANSVSWTISITVAASWSTAVATTFAPTYTFTIGPGVATSVIGAAVAGVSSATIPATSTSVAANLAWIVSADQSYLLSIPQIYGLGASLSVAEELSLISASGTMTARTIAIGELITPLTASCVSSPGNLAFKEDLTLIRAFSTASSQPGIATVSPVTLSVLATLTAKDLFSAELHDLYRVYSTAGIGALNLQLSKPIASAAASGGVNALTPADYANIIPASCVTAAYSLSWLIDYKPIQATGAAVSRAPTPRLEANIWSAGASMLVNDVFAEELTTFTVTSATSTTTIGALGPQLSAIPANATALSSFGATAQQISFTLPRVETTVFAYGYNYLETQLSLPNATVFAQISGFLPVISPTFTGAYGLAESTGFGFTSYFTLQSVLSAATAQGIFVTGDYQPAAAAVFATAGDFYEALEFAPFGIEIFALVPAETEIAKFNSNSALAYAEANEFFEYQIINQQWFVRMLLTGSRAPTKVSAPKVTTLVSPSVAKISITPSMAVTKPKSTTINVKLT